MAWTRVGHHIEQLIEGTPMIVGGNTKNIFGGGHPLVPTTPVESWLDVGGGNGEASTQMSLNSKIPTKVCVDPKAWVNDLELLGEETDWKKYRVKYNNRCPAWKEDFDIITCLDTIEHVDKKTGEKWLDNFEKHAKRLIIVFTPNGFLPQGPEQGEKFDKLEEHVSGWEVEDFLSRGYCVYRTPGDFHHNPTGIEGDWAAILAWKNKAI